MMRRLAAPRHNPALNYRSERCCICSESAAESRALVAVSPSASWRWSVVGSVACGIVSIGPPAQQPILRTMPIVGAYHANVAILPSAQPEDESTRLLRGACNDIRRLMLDVCGDAMRRVVGVPLAILLSLCLITGCAGGGAPPSGPLGPTEELRAGFPKGGVADTIRVDA